jgi:epoxyqueuosine reductase
MDDLKDRLVAQALAEGFVACRICRPSDVPEVPARLAAFVEAGYHGQMAWMEDRMEWRGNPAALWPEARSVIMLAESYAPEHDPTAVLEQPEKAAVSVYAHGRDYHDVVKKRLKRLARWLIEQETCEVKVFVDTAPVPEKALGQAAGLGWQGKHTNLLSREWGNWAFLGAIFTTLELPADSAEVDHCGSCRSCLDACPTDAFPAPYRLDARRCISYLTIEHKGPIDLELREKLGNVMIALRRALGTSLPLRPVICGITVGSVRLICQSWQPLMTKHSGRGSRDRRSSGLAVTGSFAMSSMPSEIQARPVFRPLHKPLWVTLTLQFRTQRAGP